MNLLQDICWIILSMVVFCAGLLCLAAALYTTVMGDKMGGAIGIVTGFIAMGLALATLDRRGML